MCSLPNVRVEKARGNKYLENVYPLFERDYHLREGDRKTQFCERPIDQYDQHDTSVGQSPRQESNP